MARHASLNMETVHNEIECSRLEFMKLVEVVLWQCKERENKIKIEKKLKMRKKLHARLDGAPRTSLGPRLVIV